MYSFDVFDTLITRTTALPNGIFALMQSRLMQERELNGLDDYVIDNFFELRIHSEELARGAAAARSVEEIDLHKIYEAMALCGCISDKQVAYLYQMEQDIELANVIGIDEMIQRVKELIQQGERIVLISDMYLSCESIRKMLLKADAVFAGIPLYVSSEYKKRKTTGNLYRLVHETERIQYEDWVHIGDNIHQDIEIPYCLGINAEWNEKKELTNLEKRLLDRYGNDSRLQVMIGTAVRADKKNGKSAYHIGCRYAGPVLYCYAEWIAAQAVKKKIKRLYFIARDGYLIKRIVDIILKQRKIAIDTRYIYGSRKSWRMASLSEEHYNLYQLVLWSHFKKITTLDELASVLHVPLDGLYRFLPGTYAEDRGDIHISYQELEYIARKLALDESFRKYHLYILEKERLLAQQYLIQEIDLSDDCFAFVDVSGGGLTQGCLYQLLKARYPKAIHTFFFKTDRVNLVEKSVTDVFLPSHLDSNLVVEMMCRAPHGQTDGYMEKNGKIISIMEENEGKRQIEHDFYEYEKGIEDFSRLMREASTHGEIESIPVKVILLYLEHIAHEPSKDVLEYFASTPSSETGRGKELIEYAPRLTQQEIRELFLVRTNEPFEVFYKGTDLKYSLLRASEDEKALIEQYQREHDSALGKLARLEKERDQRKLRRRWGRAAFYPTRLLEKRLVLYGAGKFGQDLYNRMVNDDIHEIMLWVDKNADECRKQGLTEVQNVTRIENVSYDQLVIAVMDKKLADSIRAELQACGISREKILWIQPPLGPYQMAEWKTEGIG